MVENLDTTTLVGLTGGKVAERLRVGGYNDLPTSRQRTLLEIALEVVREPMFLLLIGSTHAATIGAWHYTGYAFDACRDQ